MDFPMVISKRHMLYDIKWRRVVRYGSSKNRVPTKKTSSLSFFPSVPV